VVDLGFGEEMSNIHMLLSVFVQELSPTRSPTLSPTLPLTPTLPLPLALPPTPYPLTPNP